jgi:hypothetical protein
VFTAAFIRVQTVCHDLPHPGLLPKEKENRSPSHAKTCDWICRTGIRKTKDGQWLFLLPGGEGQDEGERSNHSRLCVQKKPARLATRGFRDAMNEL